jgi:uncharacterized membrane protein YccF (DUF307 family)
VFVFVYFSFFLLQKPVRLHYVSDCTVSVSLRGVIRLSQWFIMLCLWLYCISITKKSNTSITVIYHAMSLIVLKNKMFLLKITLACDFLLCCQNVRVINVDVMSEKHRKSKYSTDSLISVTDFTPQCQKSNTSITVIYHAMSLIVLYQYWKCVSVRRHCGVKSVTEISESVEYFDFRCFSISTALWDKYANLYNPQYILPLRQAC